MVNLHDFDYSLQVDDVVVVKFLNGEELIGKITSFRDSPPSPLFQMKDVLMLQYVPNGPGQMGLALIPYSMATKEKTYNAEHLMYVTTASDQLLNSYQNATGQIVTPPKTLLVG